VVGGHGRCGRRRAGRDLEDSETLSRDRMITTLIVAE
jgi:hypothetical protein